MKKILAITLAFVMMMAVMVPAYAETTITKDSPETTPQTATADVVTTFDENADWSYTITIPAGVTVAWNNTDSQAMTYKVESQLLIGASLNISAAADNGGVMTAEGTTDTLTFTVAGGDVVTFAEVNAANTTAPGVVDGENVTVSIDSFANKAVGTYTGTMTYTVEYVAPATVTP